MFFRSTDDGVSDNSTADPSRQVTPVGPTDATPFSQQGERLILDLLPFTNKGQLHAWLRGECVQGAWREFQRDLLGSSMLADYEDPSKAWIANTARRDVDGRLKGLLKYNPDKREWWPAHHYIRFVAVVIADSLATGLWSKSDWKKRKDDICSAVYEVLVFLKASHYANQQDQPPPSYANSAPHQHRV